MVDKVDEQLYIRYTDRSIMRLIFNSDEKGLLPVLKLIFISFLSFFILPAFAEDYNIQTFGAVSDTTRLSTNAINKAIEVCHSRGGGRVVVPAGQYKSGTITLRSNVELHFDRGAVLYASTRHQDFPRQQRPEYRSQKDPGGWFALIYAEGQKHI